jgi:ankyrin repeat protein
VTSAVLVFVTLTSGCATTPPLPPLHSAIKEGNIVQAKQLIDTETGLRDTDMLGNTPLHLAASENQMDIVRMLLSKGLNIEAKNVFGATPLYYAANNDHPEMVKLLIGSGANIRHRNHQNKFISYGLTKDFQLRRARASTREDTPLQAASSYGPTIDFQRQLATVSLLIEAGALPYKYKYCDNEQVEVSSLKPYISIESLLGSRSLKGLNPQDKIEISICGDKSSASSSYFEPRLRTIFYGSDDGWDSAAMVSRWAGYYFERKGEKSKALENFRIAVKYYEYSVRSYKETSDRFKQNEVPDYYYRDGPSTFAVAAARSDARRASEGAKSRQRLLEYCRMKVQLLSGN